MPELVSEIECPQCGAEMETKPMRRKGNKPPGVFGQCWQKDHRAQTLVFLRNGEAGDAGDDLDKARREFEQLKKQRR